MSARLWETAAADSADPARVRQVIGRLLDLPAASWLKTAPAGQARILAAVLAGSQVLGEVLAAHPEWIKDLDPESLARPRTQASLMRAWKISGAGALEKGDVELALGVLRDLKQREILRIAARDLARLAPVQEITAELSLLADLCLEMVFQACWQKLSQRLGTPHHLDPDSRWQPTKFCVLGLGKLGGQELNYSSDVDVLFVYEEEGFLFKTPPRRSDPPRGLGSHKFFKLLAESFIAEVNRLTPQGFLYRIDLRLRPEGPAGPLARSLQSYENFYAQYGQTWERMMLMKARMVAGHADFAHEFLETIQPFRYPRSLSQNFLREIAQMKSRIENEVVKSGEIDRNVKLGRGGIREIEFIAQSLLLMHGGKTPFLQDSQTLSALKKLVRYDLMSTDEADELAQAYVFLRDVEHRLQMENNQQTHTIPTERKARERLARLMGYPALAEFEAARKAHTGRVRVIYDKFLPGDDEPALHDFPRTFEGEESRWLAIFSAHSFRQPDQALRLVRVLVEGSGFVHVSGRTSDLARGLLGQILLLCRPAGAAAGKRLSDPDRVLARLDSFISAYGSRAMLYEMWTSNPSLFELLLLLFDRSEFLAELAIRTPDMVEDLTLSGHLRQRKTAEQILEDLRHGARDANQGSWIRRYHQTELMRIGLREILGLADFEQNLVELTSLADACLHYALEVITARHKLRAPPFAVIGLGKLGGQELTYGSDLDVIFVAAAKTKILPRLQNVATDLIELLGGREGPVVYEVDARLRPDGEKGLLVNTLPAYQDYYRIRAQLWELQALTRARLVAGDPGAGAQFLKLVSSLTNFKSPSQPPPAAWKPGWKAEIAHMRQRIERERTPPGKDRLAFKTGSGGLIDAEFVAQVFCLENAWSEPNTLRALERAEKEGVLDATDGPDLIENYRRLLGLECVLRRWSYAGESVLPDDPAALQRVALRSGFDSSETFLAAVDRLRQNIRGVTQKFLPL